MSTESRRYRLLAVAIVLAVGGGLFWLTCGANRPAQTELLTTPTTPPGGDVPVTVVDVPATPDQTTGSPATSEAVGAEAVRDQSTATIPPSTAWSRVPHDKAVFGEEGIQRMWSVTAGGPGLVAVGTEMGKGMPSGVAAVWTSADGITWSRIPHDNAVFGGEGVQTMWSVTAGGPGLVAVGAEYVEVEGMWPQPSNAAAWTSLDGITWSRVPHDEAVFGESGPHHPQEMRAVAANDQGLVAVGFDGSDDESNAAVWTSADGISWTRVPHDEANLGGPNSYEMTGITPGGPGWVAVGHQQSGFNHDAAIWTSADGITWTRVPHDEDLLGGPGSVEIMSSITAGGPGLVAVGMFHSTAGSGAAVWTSVDGVEWTRVPHDRAIFAGPGDQVMSSVTAGGPGLVAVGVSNSGAAVWSSVDGIEWTRVPHHEGTLGGLGRRSVESVIVADSNLVAVGWHGDDAAVWTTVGD